MLYDTSRVVTTNDLPLNSAKKVEEAHVVEKVTSGKVTKKKKSLSKKISETFIAEDINTVKTTVVKDVIVPAVLNLIYDAATSALGMTLGIDNRRFNRGSSGGSKIQYNSIFANKATKKQQFASRAGAYDYDEIFFETKGEAELVLSNMVDIIDEYDFVSVADMYDLAGVTSMSTTDNNYGWTELGSASTKRTSDGYILVLPKAVGRK